MPHRSAAMTANVNLAAANQTTRKHAVAVQNNPLRNRTLCDIHSGIHHYFQRIKENC